MLIFAEAQELYDASIGLWTIFFVGLSLASEIFIFSYIFNFLCCFLYTHLICIYFELKKTYHPII
jgi:hypothetical protein